LTESQLALLGGGVHNPNARQAADYCVATIAFYQQILRARPAEAAVVLRSLMEQGSPMSDP